MDYKRLRALHIISKALCMLFCTGLLTLGCTSEDGPGDGNPDSDPQDPGTRDPSVPNPGTPDNPLPPPQNPTGQAITLNIEPFVVQPGKERQVCKIINLPGDGDFDVVRFESTMVGTSHHLNIYKVVDSEATEPVPDHLTMVRDCFPAAEQLAGQAALIYAAGTTIHAVNTPETVAFYLLRNQRIILEHHVINATDQDIDASAEIKFFSAGSDAQIEHHADVIWFGKWDFVLPSGAETSATGFCTVGYDVEIFALTSHFHQLGTHFSIEKRTAAGVETHHYDNYDWQHPAVTHYDPAIPVDAGDGLEWTCTWRNTKSIKVFPGPDASDEMCIAYALFYPRHSLSGAPIQCNIPFQQ
ncbi:MAG: hypothetical protein MJE77_02280 [Proteobacteria bacterium]|nr:hypothetical protein [Pseudomonadota bacterium]